MKPTAGQLAGSSIQDCGLAIAIGDGTQGSLWEDRVVLDEVFFKALQDHPVPLQEAAIRELRDRSMSLDIYVWLAWRLQHLSKSTPISWAAAHQQFGSGYARTFHFKPGFTEALAAALAAYPDARVDVEEAGVILHPSPPPVAPKLSPRSLAIG